MFSTMALSYAKQRVFNSNCDPKEEIDTPDVGSPYVYEAMCFLADVIDDINNSIEERETAAAYQYTLAEKENEFLDSLLWPTSILQFLVHPSVKYIYSPNLRWNDRLLIEELQSIAKRKLFLNQ